MDTAWLWDMSPAGLHGAWVDDWADGEPEILTDLGGRMRT